MNGHPARRTDALGVPLIHPCLRAMIVAGGMDPADYAAMTGECLAFRTRPDIGERDTRVLPMPGLPAHTGGYTSQREIMVQVHLGQGLRFVSRDTLQPACVMTDRGVLPETVRGLACGRPARDLFGHPMFDVPGLLVEASEECGPAQGNRLRITLTHLPWVRAE